ncbi:hypothetical protein DM860_001791 [Cuscuta australis]|uniref:Uncharacterized protein n=1 Tax=Cuscuta australis TaxID=267555 RepID=A0A328EDL5_9ASTE|nr:hypothetical protein DM860_001791 [Cuscuta australis]
MPFDFKRKVNKGFFWELKPPPRVLTETYEYFYCDKCRMMRKRRDEENAEMEKKNMKLYMENMRMVEENERLRKKAILLHQENQALISLFQNTTHVVPDHS